MPCEQAGDEVTDDEHRVAASPFDCGDTGGEQNAAKYRDASSASEATIGSVSFADAQLSACAAIEDA